MKLNTLRPRRLRRTAAIRSMVRENSLELNDFVYPIFVVPGTNVKEEIPSMPGQYHLSVDNAVKMAEEVYKLGIPAVEIFGLPEYKDDKGSSAWDMTSPVQRAIRAIKEAVPDLVIVGDVCLCQYTTSGHCGQLKGHEVDIITFTSSSTVHNLMKLLDGKKELLEGVTLACIGPITADTCRSYGLAPHIVSDVYTIDGLVKAIEKNPEKY